MFSVVEYASSRLRSVATSACRIPNSADTAPTTEHGHAPPARAAAEQIPTRPAGCRTRRA